MAGQVIKRNGAQNPPITGNRAAPFRNAQSLGGHQTAQTAKIHKTIIFYMRLLQKWTYSFPAGSARLNMGPVNSQGMGKLHSEYRWALHKAPLT